MQESSQSGLQAILEEPSNKRVVQTFLQVFAATAIIPIFIYFITNYTFKTAFSSFNHPLLSPPIISGIISIFVLNLITASFALYAVYEKPNTSIQQEVKEEEEEEEEEVSGRDEIEKKEN